MPTLSFVSMIFLLYMTRTHDTGKGRHGDGEKNPCLRVAESPSLRVRWFLKITTLEDPSSKFKIFQRRDLDIPLIPGYQPHIMSHLFQQ